ncbi:SMC5-SMC6 complex localization factor protein 1 [Amia ocellicauda]|uniref:SMC5-SMC6 complex localization factor protein 1 n=1 Tax=Amia ocellicauda TaxID=2972642 RepID=UPI003463AD09
MAADMDRIFQISGIKNVVMKRKLLWCINRLGGTYTGGSAYKNNTTHLIVRQTCASEKFLAACAAGIWILSPKYVIESARAGRWLKEEPYECGSVLEMQRERRVGAFCGWKVVVLISNMKKRGVFERILKAGNATIYPHPTSSCDVTHVLTQNMSMAAKFYKAPCYSLIYIKDQIFGGANSTDEMSIDEDAACVSSGDTDRSPNSALQCNSEVNKRLFSDFENKLREQLLQGNLVVQTRYSAAGFQDFTTDDQVQNREADFTNIRSLIECCFLTEALNEIQWVLLPGVLPPAHLIHSLMNHALQGVISPLFSSTFLNTLHDILRNNPPFGVTPRVSYFLSVLQCPDCKKGTWSLLEISVRLCVSGGPCCHSLPGPANQEQQKFHAELLSFFLELFESDIHALKNRKSGGAMSSVLVKTFWSVWERSTLASRPIQQLAELLINATQAYILSKEDFHQKVVSTLHCILGLVVEYWHQDNRKQNRSLIDKGMRDLADHLSILCQDLSPEVLEEFVSNLQPPWLKMLMADAVFRNICFQNCITLGPEPLSLLKIVSSYLIALGKLTGSGSIQARNPGGRKMGQWPGIEPHTPAITPTSDSQSTANVPADLPAINNAVHLGLQGPTTHPVKPAIPRGLHKVNMAGETILHRACKYNQVEKLKSILSLPGMDINVKDHAGWTPLHEACNHGNTACVRTILQLCPAVDLLSQVGGVSPLQDALCNGHTDIAQLLLAHSGSVLLQQKDSAGKSPLDYLDSPALREELLAAVCKGDSSSRGMLGSEGVDEVTMEVCGCLLNCILLNYLTVHNLPTQASLSASPALLSQLINSLHTHGAQMVTYGWRDPQLARHAQDIETLLRMKELQGHVPPNLKSSSGKWVGILMLLLEALVSEGQELLKSSSLS